MIFSLVSSQVAYVFEFPVALKTGMLPRLLLNFVIGFGLPWLDGVPPFEVNPQRVGLIEPHVTSGAFVRPFMGVSPLMFGQVDHELERHVTQIALEGSLV